MELFGSVGQVYSNKADIHALIEQVVKEVMALYKK